MATERTYYSTAARKVITFTDNREYNSGGAVVGEQLLAPSVTLIAQAKSINRFVFSRIFGRVN